MDWLIYAIVVVLGAAILAMVFKLPKPRLPPSVRSAKGPTDEGDPRGAYRPRPIDENFRPDVDPTK